MPRILLSRVFTFDLAGRLVNNAQVTTTDPIKGAEVTEPRAVYAGEPEGAWTNDDYVAAFVAAYPTCTVTLAPAPPADPNPDPADV